MTFPDQEVSYYDGPILPESRRKVLAEYSQEAYQQGFRSAPYNHKEITILLKMAEGLVKLDNGMTKQPELPQSNLRDHMKREFDIMRRADGYHIADGDDPLNDYANAIYDSIEALMEVFISQHHSGLSGQFTLDAFSKLANFQALTPLTANPAEWNEVDDPYMTHQSKRTSSVFSDDGLKTWYDIDKPNFTRHLPSGLRKRLPKKWRFASGKFAPVESGPLRGAGE